MNGVEINTNGVSYGYAAGAGCNCPCYHSGAGGGYGIGLGLTKIAPQKQRDDIAKEDIADKEQTEEKQVEEKLRKASCKIIEALYNQLELLTKCSNENGANVVALSEAIVNVCQALGYAIDQVSY